VTLGSLDSDLKSRFPAVQMIHFQPLLVIRRSEFEFFSAAAPLGQRFIKSVGKTIIGAAI